MELQLLITTVLNVDREISSNAPGHHIPEGLKWTFITDTSVEATFLSAGLPRKEYYVKIDFTPGKTDQTGRAEFIYQLKKDAIENTNDFILKGGVQVDARVLN